MIIQVLVNVAVLLVLVGILYRMQKKYMTFTKRVFTALVLGVGFGAILQVIYGVESKVLEESLRWFSVIGSGYVNLLRMIVIPLIMVSITSAIINLKDGESLGKMGGIILGLLIATTAVSAVIGIMTAFGFGLSAEGLQSGAAELARATRLEDLNASRDHITKTIVNIIPQNPFYAMTGQGSNATLSVVVFSGLIGIAGLGIRRKKPAEFEFFQKIVNTSHDIVMRLVTLILRLTPYGILALMASVVASSKFSEILSLFKFVAASYVGLLVILIMHLILVSVAGLNPIKYLKKVFPVLTFAFTSRSSASAIPLNVETQVKQLGISEGIANLSASLGATIGQNGCAGLFPAMVAVMIARVPGSGVEMNFSFLLTLVVVTTVSSFGVAGVGGGATFAALIVLSAMNLPVGLVGLLISIEPLIDMGRTAINVSGSMVTGTVTAKILNKIDVDIYNADIDETGALM